jgi:BMFP domain-containing protein YqiC
MATSSCIDLEQATAVVEWQWEGATRLLAAPDPENVAIRFTLQLEPTERDNQHRAHFEVVIPIRFKDKPAGAAVYLRINPASITSFGFTTPTDAPDVVKQLFDTITCLDFQLNDAVTLIVPSGVKEPITASRARSGRILDSLYELTQVTTLRVYIQDSQLSTHSLQAISNRIEQHQLEPFSGPDYDISRMFSGEGGKVTTLAPLKPPSYEKATSLQPPTAPSRGRKRPRTDTHEGPVDLTQIWDKLNKLESIVREVQELRAENAKLRDLKQRPLTENVQQEDLSQVVLKLRAENAQLRDQVTLLEKKHEDLEAHVASLQTAQVSQDDADEAASIELREDITVLGHRVDFIEGYRDDDLITRIKEEVFDEIAKRIIGG